MSSARPTGPGPTGRQRRRWVPLVLVLAFVVMPVLEIYVILRVGEVVGGWWTVLLLVVDSLVGAWLVRREGARAWRALQDALRRGAVPGREIADGALVLVGGTLLLTPGFVTDGLGVLLVLPLTRPLWRRLLGQAITRRLVDGPLGPLGATGPLGRPGPRGAEDPPGSRGSGPVVPGEVVDPDQA